MGGDVLLASHSGMTAVLGQRDRRRRQHVRVRCVQQQLEHGCSAFRAAENRKIFTARGQSTVDLHLLPRALNVVLNACGMRERLRLMRCVLRTIRNDAHPRTFRTLTDLDYRDPPRLNCKDAPPPRMLCTLHTLSRAASVHAHALFRAGDVPEYNISTCILERLANPRLAHLRPPLCVRVLVRRKHL